jgi:hypothetical protein
MSARLKTKGSRLSDAALCRKYGWKRGTKLVGDEGYGPTVIQITAVGDDSILAKILSHNGHPSDEREGSWTLHNRNWRRATQ